MKKLILVSALLLFWSNAFSQSSAITEDAAIAKLHEFFVLLDINNYKKENISRIVTYDFHIFEVGNDFDLDSFDLFIKEASETIIETQWTLSDFIVSLIIIQPILLIK